MSKDVRRRLGPTVKIQSMKTTTDEATVENGQIKLPETVHLLDHTKVFVVVPEAKAEPFSIVTGEDGLPIIRTANGVTLLS
jgi:hypothetical protein